MFERTGVLTIQKGREALAVRRIEQLQAEGKIA
jgi:hypothetical protein